MLYYPVRNWQLRQLLIRSAICPECGASLQDGICDVCASICSIESLTVSASLYCTKCHVELVPGKALQSTWTGMPDFPGDAHPVTMSPGGPGKLIDCVKCPKCGYSRTFTKADQQ